MAGKLSLAPRWTGRPVAGENCLQITTRFRFLVYSALFNSSLKYNERAVIKGIKKPGLVHRGGRDFVLVSEEKVRTDLLDKCVTSAGVSRPF